jgi:hypothetical protein
MAQPQIFYYCYDHQYPTGGQKRTYKHVAILNRNGLPTFAWHREPGFRLQWFENDIPVVDAEGFARQFNKERDFLVLPEDLGWDILSYPGKKVIFNKNLYYGFDCFGRDVATCYPYTHPEVVGAIAVSDHNLRHLRFAFPNLDVIKVNTEIDPAVFRWAPLAKKKKLITATEKSLHHLRIVYHLVNARARAGLNNAQEYKWELLWGRTEAEAASLLQDTLLFLFFHADEGLSRMPIEAMKSGCLVAGFQTGALKEVPPMTFQCPYGEYMPLIEFIEQVMLLFPQGIESWEEQSIEKRWGLELEYLAAGEEESVMKAWNHFLHNRKNGLSHCSVT